MKTQISMNSNQEQIKALLTFLVADQDYKIEPALKSDIELFKDRALQNHIDKSVIDQLVDLYEVSNGFEYKIIIGFHTCNDEIIFQNWIENELLLGKKDYNYLRWKNNKFCLGDNNGNISFSEDYEFDTLIELIECCVNEIQESE